MKNKINWQVSCGSPILKAGHVMYICNMGSCDILEHAITRAEINMATNPDTTTAAALHGTYYSRT